jgi:hypothetical protein
VQKNGSQSADWSMNIAITCLTGSVIATTAPNASVSLLRDSQSELGYWQLRHGHVDYGRQILEPSVSD